MYVSPATFRAPVIGAHNKIKSHLSTVFHTMVLGESVFLNPITQGSDLSSQEEQKIAGFYNLLGTVMSRKNISTKTQHTGPQQTRIKIFNINSQNKAVIDIGPQSLFQIAIATDRYDNNSRVVASCNNLLPISKICVPEHVSRTLSVSEMVHPFNAKRLSVLWRNQGNFPGIHGYYDNSNKFVHVSSDPTTVPLPLGVILKRHLRPGDLLNTRRFPILDERSMSAMTHYESDFNYPSDLQSFSVGITNVAQTTCFKGDFDGDTVNLDSIGSQSIVAESQELTAPKYLVRSRISGRGIIGHLHSTILGAFMLTYRSYPETVSRPFPTLELARSQIRLLLRNVPNIPEKLICRIQTGAKIFGIELISYFLPKNLCICQPTGFYDEQISNAFPYDQGDKMLVIKDGVIISGVLDAKSLVPEGPFNIYDQILYLIGYDKTEIIHQNLQIIFDNSAELLFPSLLPEDIILKSTIASHIRERINVLHRLVEEVHNFSLTSNFNPGPGRTKTQAREEIILELTQNDLFMSLAVAGLNNIALNPCVLYGLVVKQSILAIGPMITLPGQLLKEGKRILNAVLNRPSIYGTEDSTDPVQHGLMCHGFGEYGFTPEESVAEAVSTRYKIIARSQGTAKPGTHQKRVMCNLLSFKTTHSGTVVTGSLLNDTQVLVSTTSLGSYFQPQNCLEVSLPKNPEEIVLKFINTEYSTATESIKELLKEDCRILNEWAQKESIYNATLFAISGTEGKPRRLMLPINLNLHLMKTSESTNTDLVIGEMLRDRSRLMETLESLIVNPRARETLAKHHLYSAFFDLKLHFVLALPPSVLRHQPETLIRDIWDDIVSKTTEAIIPGGTLIAAKYALELLQTMVQGSLDVPTKGSNPSLDIFENTILQQQTCNVSGLLSKHIETKTEAQMAINQFNTLFCSNLVKTITVEQTTMLPPPLTYLFINIAEVLLGQKNSGLCILFQLNIQQLRAENIKLSRLFKFLRSILALGPLLPHPELEGWFVSEFAPASKILQDLNPPTIGILLNRVKVILETQTIQGSGGMWNGRVKEVISSAGEKRFHFSIRCRECTDLFLSKDIDKSTIMFDSTQMAAKYLGIPVAEAMSAFYLTRQYNNAFPVSANSISTTLLMTGEFLALDHFKLNKRLPREGLTFAATADTLRRLQTLSLKRETMDVSNFPSQKFLGIRHNFGPLTDNLFIPAKKI